MSRRDVYEGEMPQRVLTDRQIEILLSGQTPGGEDLTRFGNMLVKLHGPAPQPPEDRWILALAADAARVSMDSKDEGQNQESASQTTQSPLLGLRRRLAGGLAAAVLLSGMTGVAVAADGARPGDALYGLDRALEAIGIGDGGPVERIEEARKLLEEGELSTAIGQMADAVDAEAAQDAGFSPEAAKASDALRGAAENVRSGQGSQHSEDVRGAVAAMLSEIAVMLEAEEFDGAALGARIAEMARALGTTDGEDSSPGPAENTGPSSRGQSGNAGQERGSSGENRGGPSSDTPGGPPDNTPAGSQDRP